MWRANLIDRSNFRICKLIERTELQLNTILQQFITKRTFLYKKCNNCKKPAIFFGIILEVEWKYVNAYKYIKVNKHNELYKISKYKIIQRWMKKPTQTIPLFGI